MPACKESSEIQVAVLFDLGETFQPSLNNLYMICIKDVLNTRTNQCSIVQRDVENV